MKPTKPTTLSVRWNFNLETAEFSSPPKDSEPNQILVFDDTLADGAISATITPITGQPDLNLGHDWRECCFLFRYKDQEHSYLAGIGGFGKEFFIAKISGSEWQLLAGAGQAADLKFHSSYRLKLECAGDRLRLFHSDVLILNAVDSGYSSGRCGLRVNRTEATFEEVDIQEGSVIFRSLHVVAWPIWAGEYPRQDAAIGVIEDHREYVVASIEERLHTILGVGFSIGTFRCQIGSHSPISGLFPPEYVPNSIDIFVVVSAASLTRSQVRGLTTKVIEDTVEDIDGFLATFFRTYMPGAAKGANIYDVTSRWDPRSTLSDGEPNELSQKLTKAPPATTISAPSVPDVLQRPFVFISYSHRDAKWLTRLQVHLKPIAQHVEIELWDDTRIKIGMDWRQAIDDAIKRATFAILMVSAYFLASEVIAENELPPLLAAAKSRGALVLPVILSPCLFTKTPSLSQYQAMNDPATPLVNMSRAKQEKVLNAIAERVWEHYLPSVGHAMSGERTRKR